jgi:hypothetical protein
MKHAKLAILTIAAAVSAIVIARVKMRLNSISDLSFNKSPPYRIENADPLH